MTTDDKLVSDLDDRFFISSAKVMNATDVFFAACYELLRPTQYFENHVLSLILQLDDYFILSFS